MFISSVVVFFFCERDEPCVQFSFKIDINRVIFTLISYDKCVFKYQSLTHIRKKHIENKRKEIIQHTQKHTYTHKKHWLKCRGSICTYQKIRPYLCVQRFACENILRFHHTHTHSNPPLRISKSNYTFDTFLKALIHTALQFKFQYNFVSSIAQYILIHYIRNQNFNTFEITKQLKLEKAF